jgi:hypothetical protein
MLEYLGVDPAARLPINGIYARTMNIDQKMPILQVRFRQGRDPENFRAAELLEKHRFH